MKKLLIFVFVLVISILIACGSYRPENYWVLEKSRLSEGSEVESYVMELQKNPNARGFQVFSISEGRKMVVISTGNEANSLELKNVKVVSGDTKIILSEIEKSDGENNPYIMVGLGAIEGELFVENTEGESFEELRLLE